MTMSSDASNGVGDRESRNTSDALVVVDQGSRVSSSSTSVASKLDGGKGERDSSVISEYDGAGVARRGYLEWFCSEMGDSDRETLVTLECDGIGVACRRRGCLDVLRAISMSESTSSDTGEADRDASVISEYDGAGVTRRRRGYREV
jgi:hypothetical protein